MTSDMAIGLEKPSAGRISTLPSMRGCIAHHVSAMI